MMVGAARVNARVAGAGQPLVLFHSLLADNTSFDPLAALLASTHQVIVLNLPGFGSSDPVHGSLEDVADRIGAALQQLLAGGSPISPAIARHLIRHFRGDTEQAAVPSAVRLTAREMDVLSLASKGFSYGEIAALLSLTASTVSSYTKNIYEKLAVSSRSEAVYEATRMGLISRLS